MSEEKEIISIKEYSNEYADLLLLMTKKLLKINKSSDLDGMRQSIIDGSETFPHIQVYFEEKMFCFTIAENQYLSWNGDPHQEEGGFIVFNYKETNIKEIFDEVLSQDIQQIIIVLK